MGEISILDQTQRFCQPCAVNVLLTLSLFEIYFRCTHHSSQSSRSELMRKNEEECVKGNLLARVDERREGAPAEQVFIYWFVSLFQLERWVSWPVIPQKPRGHESGQAAETLSQRDIKEGSDNNIQVREALLKICSTWGHQALERHFRFTLLSVLDRNVVENKVLMCN